MLAPASICMTASENIHSIAPQGRVELPSIPNQLMQIQHNFLSRGFQGGDCGCGCGCETYSGSGLGSLNMDGTGLFGSGVFGTGVSIGDISTWTWAEYAALGLGVWLGASLLNSFQRQASSVKRGVSGFRARSEAAKSKRAKRAKLRSEIAAL